MNELEDYVRIRRPIYEDMLITLDYQTQEIEKLKSLIDNYEEEHTTTFKLWQDTIKQQQDLKEWLEEEIKKSNYGLETYAFKQVLERLGE